MNQKTIFGHPIGLFILFFTEMWERFSYYGMRAILLLFLLDKTSGMGLAEGEGGAIYGMYTFSVYLLALPGGWLADNILGQRKAIWYGGIIIMLGHLVLAIPASTAVFFLGLGLVAIGTGLLKPNISSIVSELYPEGGARRDAAFSIFYVGINLGSFLGITIVGYLGQKIGWHVGFGAAAVAMFLGLVVYQLFAEKHLTTLGVSPKKQEITNQANTSFKMTPILWIFVALLLGYVFVLSMLGYLNFSSKSATAMSMGLITSGILVIYFANLLVSDTLNIIEKKRIGVLAVLFIGAVLFWAGFEQQGSSLQIFADRYTDLPLWMPSSWFQDFNPAFILIFSPVLGALWIYLERKNLNPSTPLKFAIGLLLLAFGYWIMAQGATIALTGVKASALFLTFTYLFHTLGELCLSPVGLSAYTKLAPKQYLSQLMGVWFVAAALGNLVAGLFAGGFDPENAHQLPAMFMSIVWFCLIVAGAILLFQGVIKKAMGGVK